MNKLLSVLVVALCLSVVTAQTCTDENIFSSVTTFTSEVTEVLFATIDNQVVYILTADHDVFLSTDGGVNFASISEELPEFGSGVSAMLKGAQDGLVYFLGASRHIYWITRGDGQYKEHYTGEDVFVEGIVPHPTDANLVLRSLSSCDGYYCVRNVEVSEAQGTENSWFLVRDYVFDFNWGAEPQQIFLVSVSDDLIDEYTQNNVSMPIIPIQQRQFMITTDYGGSYDYVSPTGCYDFAYYETVLYVAKYDDETGRSDLFLSADSGSTFVQAEFNSNTEAEHIDSNLYVLLGGEEGVTFLTVCIPGEDSVGNLFQADLTDGEFWLNIPYQRSACNAATYSGDDFQRINGLNGVYFANSYNSTMYEASYGYTADIDQYIQSEISFNKGGAWSRLSPPTSSPCAADESCNLHLFSGADSNSASIIYSRSDSVGIVLATGNEGQYRGDLEESDTYLSRNGGFTWEMTKSGTYSYATSNHGSLFVLTSKTSTDQIEYSWDQGQTWSSCPFYSQTLDVQLLMNIESSFGYPKFIMQGVLPDTGDGFFGILDFTNSIPRYCEGIEDPESENSDYEYFTPETDGICSLGEAIRYTRRKQSAVCLSNEDEVGTVEGACECGRSDFTCAGNCWREELSEGEIICVNACVGLPDDPQAPPADCVGTYMMPSGYRRVVGDNCVGGQAYDEPIETSCSTGSGASATPMPSISANPSGGATPMPSNGASISPSPSLAPSVNGTTPENTSEGGVSIGIIIGIVVGVIVVIIILLLLLIIILYKTNPKVRGLLNTYLPASMGGGSGDTKLYSVLGDGDGTNSLFMDDDMFVDEDISVPVSTDTTNLGSLLDFDDDDAEGAIDIQL